MSHAFVLIIGIIIGVFLPVLIEYIDGTKLHKKQIAHKAALFDIQQKSLTDAFAWQPVGNTAEIPVDANGNPINPYLKQD